MVRPVAAKHPVTLGYRQKANFDPNYIHRGIDYGAPKGTPVVATKGGVVVYAGQGGGNGPACGLHVIIKTDHPGSVYCAYYHLSVETVSQGERVATGQQIGKVGATGNATGNHLHYQEQTGGPGQYKTDRKPQFIDYTDGPVDKMDPKNYYVGASGDHVLWLGQRLVAHGTTNYTPTKNFTKADVKAIAAFQRKQGWSGAAADGLPGPETLKRLAAAPKPPTSSKIPGQVIDLSRAKLTTPFGKEDHPTEVKQPGLNRFADSRCFFVRDNSVVFRVTGSGVTTSGSSYPRCELREMETNGDKANWSTRTTSRRLLEGIYNVKGNAKVVVQQVHDANDDVVMVSWNPGGSIVVEWSKGKGQGSDKDEVDTVGKDEWFHLAIVAGDGVIKVLLNGTEVARRKMVRSGCYQKSGAYLQSSKSNAWAEVAIKGGSLRMGKVA